MDGEASASQDIIPVSPIISSTLAYDVIETTANYPMAANSSCIRLTVNSITIEVDDLVNPDTLTNVIKAVRYA